MMPLRMLAAILLLPFVMTVLVPRWLLRGYAADDSRWAAGSGAELAGRVGGVLLCAAGVALVGWCIALFARIGRGTLAPWDPTRRLVTEGPYRRVRNPMITGVVAILAGEAVFHGSWVLGAWALTFAAINQVYFVLVEEPGLASRFGDEYVAYRAAVPRWIPACSSSGTGATFSSASSARSSMLTLTSSAFGAGAPIPARHTCDGPDVSPPLAWSGAPQGTRSFALIEDDPDAPDPAAPKRVYVHWVLYNVPPTNASLPEGASRSALPQGAREGRNDSDKVGYMGPCPPIGRHRYFHKLYALDVVLPELGDKARKADLEKAMAGHVLAQAELIGTYEHPRGR